MTRTQRNKNGKEEEAEQKKANAKATKTPQKIPHGHIKIEQAEQGNEVL